MLQDVYTVPVVLITSHLQWKKQPSVGHWIWSHIPMILPSFTCQIRKKQLLSKEIETKRHGLWGPAVFVHLFICFRGQTKYVNQQAIQRLQSQINGAMRADPWDGKERISILDISCLFGRCTLESNAETTFQLHLQSLLLKFACLQSHVEHIESDLLT